MSAERRVHNDFFAWFTTASPNGKDEKEHERECMAELHSEAIYHRAVVQFGLEKRKDSFEEFTIALEGSLESENLVYAEPTGVRNFSWVEFEISGHPFGKPPMQLVTPARGDVFPHFPDRPYAHADLFSDLAHKRSGLILPNLYLPAQRGPVSRIGYVRTALD